MGCGKELDGQELVDATVEDIGVVIGQGKGSGASEHEVQIMLEEWLCLSS